MALVLLLAAGFALSLAYAQVTPYRTPGLLFSVQGPDGRPLAIPDVGAPDENRHANYVAYLLENGRFPILRAGSPDFDNAYQSHQPPLYYLAAAGWCRLMGLDPRAREDGFRLRALNALIGILTALGTYCAALWGWGRRDAALTACAVVALLPMHAALNGAVSNDPLLYACCAWALAACAHGIRFGWGARNALGLGVAIGLGLLTKTTALALLPMALTAMTLSSPRPAWRLAVLALSVAVLLPAAWWVRNVQVYGDPLAIHAFQTAFAGQANAQGFIERVGAWGYWGSAVGALTARSFVGIFGYMDIALDSGQYWLAWLIGAALSFGWARAMLARRGDEEGTKIRAFAWTGGVLLFVVVVLFVQFNLTFFQAQARYLFAALPAVGGALGLGAVALYEKRAAWMWLVVAAFLATINARALRDLPEEFRLRTVNPAPAAAASGGPASRE